MCSFVTNLLKAIINPQQCSMKIAHSASVFVFYTYIVKVLAFLHGIRVCCIFLYFWVRIKSFQCLSKIMCDKNKIKVKKAKEDST